MDLAEEYFENEDDVPTRRFKTGNAPFPLNSASLSTAEPEPKSSQCSEQPLFPIPVPTKLKLSPVSEMEVTGSLNLLLNNSHMTSNCSDCPDSHVEMDHSPNPSVSSTTPSFMDAAGGGSVSDRDRSGSTSSGGSSCRAGAAGSGRRGRKPARVDVKAKLERSRQSARECRARKKLRYQYLEELVACREKAVHSLRAELEQFKCWSLKLDNGVVPEDMKEYFQNESMQTDQQGAGVGAAGEGIDYQSPRRRTQSWGETSTSYETESDAESLY